MSAASIGTKRRWAVSAMVAAIAVLLLIALFRTPRGAPGAPRMMVKSPVTLHPVRADELAMQDLTPLFLPTRYNAASTTESPREPGAAFADPQPKWKFSEDDPALPMPRAIYAPAKPAEAVADVPGAMAFGIGRTNLTIPTAPPHGAYVEVFAGESGNPVLSQSLPPAARPSADGHETANWHPLEFVAAVDPLGVVGPVTLTASSGTEEVDDFFRNYLARTFRLGDRLSPGFYRVVIGP